jgi:putative nucleotidyltransferase with HDIG domain
MNSITLRNRIECVDKLASIPAVLERLLELVQDPKVSLAEISHFVSSDPGLATKVLKMVNSPIYGFPGRISSPNQAVILLGLSVVKGLLFGVTVFDLMQKSMIGLWEHSLGCAIYARLIARKKGFKDPDEASIYGLLHDIGKVLLMLQFPVEYEKIISQANAKKIPIHAAESEYFSANHAAVGSWIAEKWGFPRQLVETIGYHHKPHLARRYPVETAITHLADVLLRGRGFGFAGDPTVPPVHPDVWNLLNLTAPDVRDVLKEAEGLLEEAEELSL